MRFYTVWKEAVLPTKCDFCDCCRNIGCFVCGVETAKFCEHPVALYRQQPEKDKNIVDVAHPWKNFCGRPWLQAQADCYIVKKFKT